MTTTYTEELPFEVVSYRSKKDGHLVIEIDTSWEEGEEQGLRVNLNDGPIWEGDPFTESSAFAELARVRSNNSIYAASFTEPQWTEKWRDQDGEHNAYILVEWSDVTETPSQCISRLNTEVVEGSRNTVVYPASPLGEAIIQAAAGLWSGGDVPDWRENEYVRGQVETLADVIRVVTALEYADGDVDGEEIKDRVLALIRGAVHR